MKGGNLDVTVILQNT